jgi:MFS superfamily sulfate permease-like transporter
LPRSFSGSAAGARGFAAHAAALFALIPIGAVGALLILAGADLAISRRLFDGKPSCLWVIGATALLTVTINPALGLILGRVGEFICAAIVLRLIPETKKP